MFWRDTIQPDEDNADISLSRGEWIDKNRNDRRIPYKIYMPKNGCDGPLPVVFWAHGLGGSRDGAGFLSRYIASHGYIVINTQHIGTDTSLWAGKPGHPWDVIRATKITDDVKFARMYDIHTAIQHLKELDLPANSDLDNIGMSGHSMGAITTQVMAGQKFRNQDLSIDAFKAFIAYSEMPCEDGSDNPYENMSRPIMTMTGTEDDSPIDGYGYEKRLEVYDKVPAKIKHSLVLKDGDHMVFSGSRGQLQGYDKIPVHENIIKIASLAWWDWHLKGMDSAKDWLDNNLVDWAAGEVDHRHT